MKTQPETLSKKTLIYSSLSIFTATFVVFSPSLLNDFVNWDDNLYVYENNYITHLNFSFFKWAFSVAIANWHPLTLLSHAVDYQIWGLNPFGHHLTNILLHGFNTILVYFLTLSLLSCRSRNSNTTAKITALLFGLHPLHVESVAWISERKDLLCGFFYLLSLIYYIKYATSNSKKGKHYLISLGAFLLASMSKPMAVSLPVVLLILDYYPLRRFYKRTVKEWILFFKEKSPFFLAALALAITTFGAQEEGGAMSSLQSVPFNSRLFIALNALKLYILKTFLPFSLAPFYPHPVMIDANSIEHLGSLLFFLVISLSSLFYIKRKKLFTALWLYFLITLLPVIGLVQVGTQAAADRYMYLPGIAPLFLMGLTASSLLEKSRSLQKKIALFFLVLLFFIFSTRTVGQIAIWKDSVSLWSYEIRVYPARVSKAYNNRGTAYINSGLKSKAIDDFDMAITLQPYEGEYRNNRANAYYLSKEYDKALNDYNMAVKLSPENAVFINGRGLANLGIDSISEAIKDFTRALQIDPGFVGSRINLAKAYSKTGSYEQSLDKLDEAASMTPTNASIYFNKAMIYGETGKHEAAIVEFGKALRINQNYLEAFYNRGISYGILKDYSSAIGDFNAAIAIRPDYAEAYNSRGIIYHSIGKYDLAIRDYEKVIELNPKDGGAYYNAGLSYIKLQNIEKATIQFNKAAKLGIKRAQLKLEALKKTE